MILWETEFMNSLLPSFERPADANTAGPPEHTHSQAPGAFDKQIRRGPPWYFGLPPDSFPTVWPYFTTDDFPGFHHCVMWQLQN